MDDMISARARRVGDVLSYHRGGLPRIIVCVGNSSTTRESGTLHLGCRPHRLGVVGGREWLPCSVGEWNTGAL